VRVVFVHGAGDTARVWRRVRARLEVPSVAVDLLGRASRPYDLTRVTAADAARVAANDVREAGEGPWVVVAHSAGGIVAPRLVAELGDVRHLVLIAGVVAPEGGQPVDVVQPARRAELEERRGPLFAAHRNHTFVSRHEPAVPPLPEGLVAVRDARVVQAIDSLRLLFEVVSWQGVPAEMPRTWVRPRRDSLQTPEVQERLVAASGATQVLDIDTDHTPARDDPEGLAALLSAIVS
jgi:pimeloyl-ACP methyl ester carboxylesterase